jgi:trigger factor
MTDVKVKKVEKLKQLERKLLVEIPEQKITEACHAELLKLAKTQSLKGFRKGKVPMSVVKKRFGQDVKMDIIRQLMQQYFYMAIQQEKLQPASAPAFDIVSEEPAKPLVFSAIFEVYPDIKLPTLKSLKVNHHVTEINAEAVTEMLEKLRKQHGEWADVDRASQEGDQVNMNYVGKLKGEAFEGGTANDANLELGSKQFIPGFEEGLVGLKAGDEKDVKLKFPKEYHAENLAGKAVVFEVKINKVQGKTLPELDETFVKKLGIESGKIDDLSAEIESTMIRESQKASQHQVKQEIFKAFADKAKVDIPNAMLDQEIAAMQDDMKTRLQQQGQASQNLPDFPREHFEEQAKQRVKLGLLINALIAEQGLKVDDEKMKQRIAEVAAQYDDPQEVISWYEQHEEQRRKLESLVLEDQVVEFMLNSAKITEKNVTYEELMNPQSQ